MHEETTPQLRVEPLPLDRNADLDSIKRPEVVVADATQPRVELDPEFEQLLTPLKEDELTGLHESLKRDGCLSPLLTWGDILLDGHNRYRFCVEAKIPFVVNRLEFPDRKAAFNWIVDNQLARRNVTPQMASYLRGKKYIAEKQAEGRPDKLGQNDPVNSERTSSHLASQFGVGEKTIRRDAEFAAAIDQAPKAVRNAVLSGRSIATKKEVIAAAETGNYQQLTTPRPKPQKTPNTDHTNKRLGKGVFLANEAINALIRIPKDDPSRDRGFEIVTDYIASNSLQKPQDPRTKREKELVALLQKFKAELEQPRMVISMIDLKVIGEQLLGVASKLFRL